MKAELEAAQIEQNELKAQKEMELQAAQIEQNKLKTQHEYDMERMRSDQQRVITEADNQVKIREINSRVQIAENNGIRDKVKKVNQNTCKAPGITFAISKAPAQPLRSHVW